MISSKQSIVLDPSPSVAEIFPLVIIGGGFAIPYEIAYMVLANIVRAILPDLSLPTKRPSAQAEGLENDH